MLACMQVLQASIGCVNPFRVGSEQGAGFAGCSEQGLGPGPAHCSLLTGSYGSPT